MNYDEFNDLDGFDEIRDFNEEDLDDLEDNFDDSLLGDINVSADPGIGHYQTFLGIAMRNFGFVKQLCAEREELQSAGEEVSEDNMEEIFLKSASIQRYSIQTVVFCHLAVESFINYYGLIKLSGEGVNISNLNLKEKWLKVPELVCGSPIKEKQKVSQICNLFMSIKGKMLFDELPESTEQSSGDWISEEEAITAVEGASTLFYELKKLDPKLDLSWIESSGKDPFV